MSNKRLVYFNTFWSRRWLFFLPVLIRTFLAAEFIPIPLRNECPATVFTHPDRVHTVGQHAAYISELIDHGININTVRAIAGHKDEHTTFNNYCYDLRTSSERHAQVITAIHWVYSGVTKCNQSQNKWIPWKSRDSVAERGGFEEIRKSESTGISRKEKRPSSSVSRSVSKTFDWHSITPIWREKEICTSCFWTHREDSIASTSTADSHQSECNSSCPRIQILLCI